MPVIDNEVYLTFDDGPHPDITPFVLDLLKEYDAKATFFCIGNNVLKYPFIYKRIIDEGHSVGNHTYQHLNGWKTSDKDYLEDIIHAQKYIDSKLFRPPYGRITRFQTQAIKAIFKIIMWDILSGDFDQKISGEECLANVLTNITAGSIVVFHDSEKAFGRLSYALPKTLQFLKDNNLAPAPLPPY